MTGALLIAFTIVVLLPVAIMMTGAVVAALVGWSLKDNGEATHEGSELIELNG
jgi:hypothetical protein